MADMSALASDAVGPGASVSGPLLNRMQAVLNRYDTSGSLADLRGAQEAARQVLRDAEPGTVHEMAARTGLGSALKLHFTATGDIADLNESVTPAGGSRGTGHPDRPRINHHYRVRRDRADTAGVITIRYNSRLHHIGLGRKHAGTRVLALIADLNIRVINAETGQLLRDLTLKPSRDYQPLGRPPEPSKQATK